MRLVALAMLVGCGRVGFDARTESNVAPDAAAMPFCATVVADFCSDFDDGTTTGWTLGGKTNGDYAVVARSLESTTTDLASASDIGEAYVNHRFNQQASRITFAFDLQIVDEGQGEVVVGQLRFLGSPSHGVEYVYRAGSSYMEEFRDTTYDSIAIPGPSLPVGEWHRIEIDLDVRATPRVTLKQDGTMVVDTPLLGNVTGDARVSLGTVFLRGPAAGWTLRTDNAVADIE